MHIYMTERDKGRVHDLDWLSVNSISNWRPLKFNLNAWVKFEIMAVLLERLNPRFTVFITMFMNKCTFQYVHKISFDAQEKRRRRRKISLEETYKF